MTVLSHSMVSQWCCDRSNKYPKNQIIMVNNNQFGVLHFISAPYESGDRIGLLGCASVVVDGIVSINVLNALLTDSCVVKT